MYFNNFQPEECFMKKKVLLISILYKPNVGGIENSIHHLAIEYEKLGYEVDILSSDRNNVSSESLKLSENISDNIKLFRYKFYRNGIYGFFKTYNELYNLINTLTNRANYDVVIGRSSLSVIACRHVGIKNVTYLLPGVVKYQSNESNLYSKISFIKSLRLRLSNAYNHILQYIAVRCSYKNFVFSKNMDLQVKNALGIEVNKPIMKPGVDTKRFFVIENNEKKMIRIKLNIPEDKKIILGLGRFVKAKGFDAVINSLQYLPDDYVVCLVGHGVELSVYKELVNKLKISDRVIIKNPTLKPEDYYQLADFFAMSSTYEPLGQTILEAQACGLPIIALDSKGMDVITAINEVTNENTRELYKKNDGEYFAKAILNMNTRLEKEEISCKSISEYAYDKFSWKVLAENLI